jgi:outer membrane lipoprotein-sorting protein
MKLKTLTITFFLLRAIAGYGQSDPQAIKILDSFSAKAFSTPSVSMKFSLVTVNQMESTSDTLKGSVIMNKDKYRLELPDNIVYFNGETSWSYLPAEKEVTITKANRRDNSFQDRPSAIFSMYRKGYKCRLVEEKAGSSTIDLYPEDLKSDLSRIRIITGKPGLNLISLEYKRKDGIISTLHVLDYNLTRKPANDEFVFDASKHKDVDVIDMR